MLEKQKEIKNHAKFWAKKDVKDIVIPEKNPNKMNVNNKKVFKEHLTMKDDYDYNKKQIKYFLNEYWKQIKKLEPEVDLTQKQKYKFNTNKLEKKLKNLRINDFNYNRLLSEKIKEVKRITPNYAQVYKNCIVVDVKLSFIETKEIEKKINNIKRKEIKNYSLE